MSIEKLQQENNQIVAKAGKMRTKYSRFPRLLRNWFRNTDGEADCQEQIFIRHSQMIEYVNSGLSKITQELENHALETQAMEKQLYRDLYIVHSLPKVGGSTIAATLRSNFKRANVYHVHCLTERGFRNWSMALLKYNHYGRGPIIAHIEDARKGAMTLEARKLLFPTTHKSVVVCGVREPVAWALSLYFQTYASLVDENYDAINVAMVTEFIVKVLEDKMCDLGTPYMSPGKWLSDEFSTAHNLDVFDCGFDVVKGYQIYDQGNTPILLIRQENLSNLPEALSTLVGYPEDLIEPVEKNTATSKSYSAIYKSMMGTLKLDEGFLRSIYSGRYCKKFYTETERESFLKRWVS